MKDLKKVKPSRKPGPADLRRSHILQSAAAFSACLDMEDFEV
jgi:hypothetical protein